MDYQKYLSNFVFVMLFCLNLGLWLPHISEDYQISQLSSPADYQKFLSYFYRWVVLSSFKFLCITSDLPDCPTWRLETRRQRPDWARSLPHNSSPNYSTCATWRERLKHVTQIQCCHMSSSVEQSPGLDTALNSNSHLHSTYNKDSENIH